VKNLGTTIAIVALGFLFCIPQASTISSVGYYDLFRLSPEGADALSASALPLKSDSWLDLSFKGSDLTGDLPTYSLAMLFPVGEFSQMGFLYGQGDDFDQTQRNLSGIFTLRPIRGLTWGVGFKTREIDSEYRTQFEMASSYEINHFVRTALSFVRTEDHYRVLSEVSYKDADQKFFIPLVKVELGFGSEPRPQWPIAFGAGFSLGEKRPFELMTKLYKEESGFENLKFGSGILLRQNYEKTEIKLNYSFMGLGLNGSSDLMSHGVGLGFSFGALEDFEVPRMVIRLEKTHLSQEEIKETPFRFIIDAKDNSGSIGKWVLVISEIQEADEIRGVFHSIRGEGQPPRYIEWNGKTINHKRAKPGKFAYRVLMTDKRGNTSASDWQYLEIN
jgi:hypothetical protein